MENLLENLNPEQLKAVMHRDGPLLIVAGAGTGKTTAITQRIAWLIEQGLAKPENILALTFTDKAAGEMEERVDLLLPYGYVDLQISTFHAFCEHLLREYGVEIGLPRDFKVVSELDAWLLARQHIDRFELDHYRPLGNPTKYIRALLTHFSRAKDAAVTAEQYLTFAEKHCADLDTAQADDERTAELKRLTELANAYHAYQSVLLENDALDFGDLLLYSLKLLRERPRVLEAVRKRFSFVLVDEFQDTNHVQYELVKLIASPKNNLTVVGDDDQAIYAFRGASVANILRFQEDFPAAEKIVLTRNYRSAQSILDRAYAFIQKNNPHRLEAQDESLCKRLTSSREGDGDIEHIHCPTSEAEADAVAKKIVDIRQSHPEAAWNDFGILVRSNDSASGVVAAFERRNIPFQFLALSGLYTKPVILDLQAYMRVIDNPHDSPSLYRVLTLPMHNIPTVAIVELTHFASRKGKSLFDACRMMRGFTELDENAQTAIDHVLTNMAKLRESASTRKMCELFVMMAKDTGYVEYVNSLPEQERNESFRHLQQFYERIKGFEERHDHPVLRNFLEEFKHERDAGEEGALAFDIEAGPETVKIMTVHASKGLEFRFVFVVNMVDRRFPSQARADAIPLPDGLLNTDAPAENAHLEEERRLFYVAMTRAKDGLYFTSADDYGGARKRKLSRFLNELGYDKPAVEPSPIDPFQETAIERVEDRTLVIHLPKQFSFTQLTAFRNCPLQYKFAHVLKIPVFGKWTLSYGKTMHNTLQQFFTAWMERTGQQQTSLFDAPVTPSPPKADQLLAETSPGNNRSSQHILSEPVEDAPVSTVSLKELLEMYEASWIDEWYVDDAQREKYRAKGRENLKGLHASLAAQQPNPLYLEQGFTLKIKDVVLKGRIDRIDRFEDGVEIIDYKTGSPKTAKDLERADKEQLFLYQLAARDILELNPKKLTFHYLDDNSRVSFIGSGDELIDLQEAIVERVANIRDSAFNPTPGFHCRYCDFADICEFRQK